MVSPITNRLIPAEILTSSHYLFGQVKVIQSGLMGMLTDTTSSFLEVNEASISPIQKPSNVTNYATQLFLVRSRLVAVCLNKREYMGTQGVMKASFQRSLPYSVQISTSIYDISGTFEWSGRFEFSALLTEGTSSYLIIYDALLTAPLFPELKIESPVILLNRNFIETFIITKKPTAVTVGGE